MNWLLDCHLNNGILELVGAIQSVGCAHKFFTMDDELRGRFNHFPDDEPMVFYGSFQVAELIAAKKPSWKPGPIYDPECMRWQYYAPRIGKELLNHEHVIETWQNVQRNWNLLTEQFGAARLFIRPESPAKSFSGQVVGDLQTFIKREGVYLANMAADTLIVVSQPRPIGAEYRFLVVNGQVVTGSGYRRGGLFEPFPDFPESAGAYAQAIADRFNPSPAFMIDVAESDGHRVVEVGPFSCCSMYEMDRRLVVEAINSLPP